MLTLARILLFFQIVLIAAALGAVAAFILVMLLGTLTRADNINGGLAMGAAGMTPVGAVVGVLVGAWLGWRAATRLRRGTVMGLGYGIFALTALSIGGWFLVQELTDGNPYEMGAEPVVLVEWRLPELVPHDRVQRVYRHGMRSTYMDWPLTTLWDEPFARDEEGRTILRFRGLIRWRAAGRIFQLWQAPNHDDRITVELGLPGDPGIMDDFGPWQDAQGAPGYAFRTRVIGPR